MELLRGSLRPGVTIYVSFSLVFMLGFLYFGREGFGTMNEVRWVLFGCLGALVHLLNHALTTTRLQTFELSETRKIWPRLLLGGMFGFILPWLLSEANLIGIDLGATPGPADPDATPEPGGPVATPTLSPGLIAAFFGGYSVRFATGLIERVLSAVFPETKPK